MNPELSRTADKILKESVGESLFLILNMIKKSSMSYRTKSGKQSGNTVKKEKKKQKVIC